MLLFLGSQGIAQMSKYSFGAGVSNGVLSNPEYTRTSWMTGEEYVYIQGQTPYVFGLQGSFFNFTNKWLAWKTTLNLGGSQRYENLLLNEDGSPIPNTNSRQLIWGDIGFGPIFTYQKNNFGIYIGGSLDFSYVGSRSVSEGLGHDNWYYNTSILTIPTIKCGYWQRLGGDESPFLLEIELVRSDMVWGNTSVWNTWNEYRNQINRIFLLTVGFRYEINNP